MSSVLFLLHQTGRMAHKAARWGSSGTGTGLQEPSFTQWNFQATSLCRMLLISNVNLFVPQPSNDIDVSTGVPDLGRVLGVPPEGQNIAPRLQ